MRNLKDPGFDLSTSLNVKCNFAVDFLLLSNNKHVFIAHALAVLDNWKIYHLAKTSDKGHKIESLLPGSEGKATRKSKVD